MKKVILITGGQRSGKSSFAEQKALSLSSHPVYLATARVWDDEFRKRIKCHQKNRGPEWTNIEEEKNLSRCKLNKQIIVVDCVTLWCANFFFDLNSDIQAAFSAIKSEFDKFTIQENTFIFVTNEIGLGGVSDNHIQRRFADLQGLVNQYIASHSEDIFLMISGIPVKIK